MGTVTYFILLAIEAAMLFWSIRSRQAYRRERGLVRIASLIVFATLTFAGIYKWGFQYVPLLILLVIQSAVGIVILVRAKDRIYTKSGSIWRGIRNSLVCFWRCCRPSSSRNMNSQCLQASMTC